MRNERTLIIRQTHLHRLGEAILLVLGGLSVFLSTGSIAIPSPPVAVGVTFIAVFLLPGFLITRLLSWQLGYVERVAASFALSVGVWCIPAVLLLQLHSNLGVLTWIFFVVTILLVSLYLYQSRATVRVSETDEGGSDVGEPLNPFLLGAFVFSIFLALFLFLSTANIVSSGDRWSYLGTVRQHLDTSHFLTKGRFLPEGPISSKHRFAGWTVLLALVSKISQVDPLDIYSFYLPPLLMVVSCLAFYSLVRELLKKQNLALFASLVQMLYYFSDMQSVEGMGIGFFGRIVEDKFVAWLIVAPAATLLALRYLSGRRSYFLGLFLATAALGLTHPMGLTQFAMSFGSFALVHLLINWDREKVLRFTGVFIPIVVFYVVPLVQRQSTETSAFAISTLNLNGLHANRILPISDSHYIAHPHLIQHPMTILAILLALLSIRFIKKSVAVQLLFSNMAIPLFTIYHPLAAPLLGKLITPRMIWRVAWILPVSLTIGFFVYKGLQKVQWPFIERVRSKQLMPVLVTILAALLLKGHIDRSLENLKSWYYATEISPTERAILACARDQVSPGSAIMAQGDVNTHLPAIVGHSYGIVFRQNTANPPSGYGDIEQFYNTQLIDQSTLGLLKKYKVRYVVVETENPLACQFSQLPSMFALTCRNDDFELYEVASEFRPNHIINGNTHLAQGEWEAARAEFETALQGNPNQPLAMMGLGSVYEAHQDFSRALEYYEIVARSIRDGPWLQIKLADLYYLTHQTETDQEIASIVGRYGRALEMAPDNKQVYDQVLAAFARLPDRFRHSPAGRAVQESILAFYQARADAAPNFWGQRELADVYEQLGDETRAIEQYRRMSQRFPDRLFPHLRLAEIFLEQSRIDMAVQAYHDAIAVQPESYAPYLGLARLYRQQGKYKRALEYAQEAVAVNPDSPNLARAHMEVGYAYQAQQKTAEALEQFLLAIELEPTVPGYHEMAGGAYWSQGNLEQAIAHFRRAIELPPDWASKHISLGDILLQLGQRAEGMEELEKALLLGSKSSEVHRKVGELYLKYELPDRAISCYEQAIRLDPTNVGTHLGLSRLYRQEGEYEAAVEYAQKTVAASQDSPSIARAHMEVGYAYQAQQKTAEALEQFLLAIELQPTVPGYHEMAGGAYWSQGNLEQAIAHYRRAVELPPDWASKHLSLGAILLGAGYQTEGMQELEKGLSLKPESTTYWYVGEMYLKHQTWDEAQPYFEQAVKLDPSYTQAYQDLVSLHDQQGG